MLSSLIALLQALRQTLSERLFPRPAAASPQVLSAVRGPTPSGAVEISYRRDSDNGLETQSVWLRVDTRKLVEILLERPDIDLDALQGVERRGQRRCAPVVAPPVPEAPPWQQKAQRVTQAPPVAARGVRRRIPPPPNSHRH